MFPDYGGFADDDIGGVINKNSVANLCRRVEIHAELAADDVLEHLGRELTVFFPEHMCYAVGLQALKTLEKQKRFQISGAGGVAKYGSPQIVYGIVQKFRMLDVQFVENLFQLSSVNDFSRQLAGKRYRKHFRKVLAAQDLFF